MDTVSADTRQQAARPLNLSDILVVTKQSKVEYDCLRLNISEAELASHYLKEGMPSEKIFLSHQRQKTFTDSLLKYFSAEQIIKYNCDDEGKIADIIKKYKLIISFGGDNHFQRIARHTTSEQIIAGVNSDPQTSRGALLPYSSENIDTLINNLQNGNFTLQPWTRINVRLDNQELPPVLCDVFLGEKERQYMSRYTLSAGEKNAEQKSSGLLVTTGAGSGGWYSSATAYLFPDDASFPKTCRELRFAATEISKSGNTTWPYGSILEGEKLTVQSLNDSEGILALDSLSSYSFPSGHKAELSVSTNDLWTVS